MEAFAHLAASHFEDDGSGGGRIVADLALQLLIGIAVTGGRRRKAHSRQHFARLERGEKRPPVEVARRDLAAPCVLSRTIGRIEALHQRRHVIAGIAAADIAADRAAIAHLRIGDLQSRSRV